MFEIPEYVTLARQMGEGLAGRHVASGRPCPACGTGGTCYYCPACQQLGSGSG
jgi:hypothetical protein